MNLSAKSVQNASDRTEIKNIYLNSFAKYDIEEVGGAFRVLATTPTFDNEKYLRVFRKMSFGFRKPKIMRAERKDD